MYPSHVGESSEEAELLVRLSRRNDDQVVVRCRSYLRVYLKDYGCFNADSLRSIDGTCRSLPRNRAGSRPSGRDRPVVMTAGVADRMFQRWYVDPSRFPLASVWEGFPGSFDRAS